MTSANMRIDDSEERTETYLTDAPSSVRIENLTKVYGSDILAVDDVSLDIKEGELVVLLGPSGCGKSTTLNCLAGLIEPTSGRIRIDDDEVTTKKPKDRDIAYVFQSIALFPHMTVRENIRFGLDMKTDLQRAAKNEKVERVAETLGIDEMLDRKPAALSGGQRQRVSLGRAMVMEPAVFLLDEPFAALDANLRDQMQVEVKKLQRDLQTAMVFVTHDQQEALTLGDRIVVMNDGQIKQVGTPHEIYNDPQSEFVADFIGSPTTNVFTGTLVSAGDSYAFQSDLMTVDLEGRDEAVLRDHAGETVRLGIRPEYIQVNVSDPMFTPEIEVIEPQGAYDVLYLSMEDTEIRVLTAQGSVDNAETKVPINFDQAECWLFSMEGDRIL